MNAEDRQAKIEALKAALKEIIPNADDWPEDRNPRVYSRSTTVQFRGVDLKLQVEADYDASPYEWVDEGKFSTLPTCGAIDLVNDLMIGEELEEEYIDDPEGEINPYSGDVMEIETGKWFDSSGEYWTGETVEGDGTLYAALPIKREVKPIPYDWRTDGHFWTAKNMEGLYRNSDLTEDAIDTAVNDWNEIAAFGNGDYQFFGVEVVAEVEGVEIGGSSVWGVSVESLADDYLNDEVLNMAATLVLDAPQNVQKHIKMNEAQSDRFTNWLDEYVATAREDL